MTGPVRVWIQGAGEMASGAALALLAAGHRVIMAEIDNPLSVRRLVCFSEAVYEGSVTVAGWPGVCVPAAAAAFVAGRVTVLVDPVGSQVARLGPDLVVDARMTKRTPAPLPGRTCPLIGLGPGFRCGRDADLVIETMRGPSLGAVLDSGGALADTGRPGPVGGETAARILRAPAAGHLVADCRIGDQVVGGQIVGHVGGRPVVTRLGGCLRGLVHGRAELSAGEKVGDVDPRGAAVDPAAPTDKALEVGRGVLKALGRLGLGPQTAV